MKAKIAPWRKAVGITILAVCLVASGIELFFLYESIDGEIAREHEWKGKWDPKESDCLHDPSCDYAKFQRLRELDRPDQGVFRNAGFAIPMFLLIYLGILGNYFIWWRHK